MTNLLFNTFTELWINFVIFFKCKILIWFHLQFFSHSLPKFPFIFLTILKRAVVSPCLINWLSRFFSISIICCFLWHLFILLCHLVCLGLSFPGGSDSKESTCRAGDSASISWLGRFPGEGNGNALQYSCLENSMDKGAWWAKVPGVTKCWTGLCD